jgi:hypothetical protein
MATAFCTRASMRRSDDRRTRQQGEEGNREMRRIYTAIAILDLLLLLLWLCARPL